MEGSMHCLWTYKRQLEIAITPSNQSHIQVHAHSCLLKMVIPQTKWVPSFSMLGDWPDYDVLQQQQFYIISPFDGPRTPKRTPMACQFCRGKDLSSFVSSWRYIESTGILDYHLGRKLKCDGMKPSCANCNWRGYPCAYAPVSGWVDKMNINECLKITSILTSILTVELAGQMSKLNKKIISAISRGSYIIQRISKFGLGCTGILCVDQGY